MKKITRNTITAFLFLCVMFGFSVTNLERLGTALKTQLANKNWDSLQNATASVQDAYKDTFREKNRLIDLYGVVQLGLHKSMIGNFEFIKDTNGIMHRFTKPEDTTGFCSDMQKLKSKLDVLGTPLLYVQDPARELSGYTKFAGNIKVDGNSSQDSVVSSLKANSIDYIDIRDKIAEGKCNPKTVYLKTDIHMTTETELWVLQNIVSELEQRDKLQFENKKQVLSLNNYKVISKDLLGNLSRSSGAFFAGLDHFNMYVPKFNTSMTLTNPTSAIVKKGTFQEVIMNGLENNSDSNNMTYWITNYLQYPSPCYEIKNNNVEKNNILIIMDSTGLRTASYLSLMVHSLTVIDPRFQGNTSYIDEALATHQYDAVIVLQGDSTTLVPKGLFPSFNPQAEILSDTLPTQMEPGKSYDFTITVKNTGTETWDEIHKIRLGYLIDGTKDNGYRVALPEGKQVKPGEEYTFEIKGFTVPNSFQTLEFGMLEESIQWFGGKKQILFMK